MILSITAALLMAAAPTAAPADLPKLSLEQAGSLRCASAFALTSALQQQGDTEALRWPQQDERVREFFVRVNARLMDETGADRATIENLSRIQVAQLRESDSLARAMPACLLMLEGSGL